MPSRRNHPPWTLAFAALLVLAGASLAAADATKFLRVERDFLTPEPEMYVPDEFVVVLTPEGRARVEIGRDRFDLPTANASSLNQRMITHQVVRFEREFPTARPQPLMSKFPDLTGHYLVKLKPGVDLEAAMADFAADPLVDRVEKIGIHFLSGCATGPTQGANDTYYDNPPPTFNWPQWDLWDTQGIDADKAWPSETGDATVVVVAMDSGVRYRHRDLGGSDPPGPADNVTNGNIWVNPFEIPGNGIDDEGNGYIDDVIGWDFVTGTTGCGTNLGEDCSTADNDPADHNGHGTHVAGTMAAISNNANGIAGIAGGWGEPANGSKIMCLRMGYTTTSGQGVVRMDFAAQAINYVADMKARGVNVAAVNASWGSSNSGGIDAAVNNLLANDVMLIHAAGNANANSPGYLGDKDGVLNVAATDKNGLKASFSNFGAWVDMAAPGVDIISTYHYYPDPANDYVAVMDGTSMAAPHVAGVAALLESKDPGLSGPDKFSILVNNTCPAGSPNIGNILNAKLALDAVVPPCDITADFSGTPTSGCAPLTVNFTDLSTGAGISSWSWNFGDGGSSTQQHPQHTYNAPGTYNVTLTASSAICSDGETKNGYITVSGAPTAEFSGTPTTGTAPLTVNFTDLSSGGATSWTWNFGDGSPTSSAQHPSHVYNVPGDYTVSLTAANACGSDVETKVNYIHVDSASAATQAFALSDLPVSGSVSGTFSNTHASDNVYQVITEVLSGGKPSNRHSLLEHRWDFNVAGGSSVVFKVEAYRPNNADGDNFTFGYSTDNVNFTAILTVASATEQVYSEALPSNLSGTVYIRVIDTDRSAGKQSLDAIFIDRMFIESSGTPPPAEVMHVGGLVVTRETSGGNRANGVATVTIVNASNVPVPGATVTGVFTGPNGGTRSGSTNGSGVVVFTTDRVKNPSGEWCFEVTNVTRPGDTYDPAANVWTKACESGGVFALGKAQTAVLPEHTSLAHNYPNPFNAQTAIGYRLAESGHVRLEIYNLLGARVRVLADGYATPGEYSAVWDGRAQDGREVASGVYFYRLALNGAALVRPMTLLK